MLSSKEQMDIIKGALQQGYKGPVHELIEQASTQKTKVASTPEQQEEGLRNQPQGTSMVFPESSGDFNTQGMQYPIDIKKYDGQGDLVRSYENVPPSIENLPMGDDVGTVVETPSQYQSGGFDFHKTPTTKVAPETPDSANVSKYHYSQHDPEGDSLGHKIANIVTPKSMQDFAMGPITGINRTVKTAYLGGKSLIDKYFQEGGLKEREGETYVADKMATIKDPVRNTKQFSDKPMYEGHEPSTHLMADDNKKTAWPTLFQDSEGNWYKGDQTEAKRKGEIYKFDSTEKMIDFARKGNWKNTYKDGGLNIKVIGEDKEGETDSTSKLVEEKIDRVHKGKDFNEKWLNSPMYKQMVKKEDPTYHKYITHHRKQNLKDLDVQVHKHQPEQWPGRGGQSYTASGLIDIFPYGDKTTEVHEFSHSSDRPASDGLMKYWKPKSMLQGAESIFKTLHPITSKILSKTNLKPPSSYVQMSPQEAYSGQRLIPKSSRDKIASYREGSYYDAKADELEAEADKLSQTKQLNKGKSSNEEQATELRKQAKQHRNWANYVADPTETRARIIAIRQRAADLGIYDPFTQEIDNKQYKKLLEQEKNLTDKPGFNPLGQLRDMYSDEEIQDLLNTMSFNTNNPNDIYGDSELSGDMQIAKKGGIHRKQFGGFPSYINAPMVMEKITNSAKNVYNYGKKAAKVATGLDWRDALRQGWKNFDPNPTSMRGRKEFVKELIPVNARTFIRNLGRDRSLVTEDRFSKSEINRLSEVLKNRQNSGYVTYTDYHPEGGIHVRESSMVDKLTDPTNTLQLMTTIGKASVEEHDDHYIVTDDYDFNKERHLSEKYRNTSFFEDPYMYLRWKIAPRFAGKPGDPQPVRLKIPKLTKKQDKKLTKSGI